MSFIWSLLWGQSTPNATTSPLMVNGVERKLSQHIVNEIDIVKYSEFLHPFKQQTYCANLESVNEVDLRNLPYYFKCYDQGQLGSCTAQGWTFAYVFNMGKQGETYVDMSRLAFYNCERQLLGSVESDSGAQISTGADTIKKFGICLESMCPYDVTKFADPLSQECMDNMKLHIGVEATRVKKTIKDLKQCLIDGYPFVFGFKVYESFMQTGPDGIVKMPDVNKEKLLGGHCVVCVGFKKINGKDYFVIRNSWGCNGVPSGIYNPPVSPTASSTKGWGDDGHCYMDFDFMMEKDGLFGLNKMCSDFWVLKRVKDLPDPNVPKTNEQKIEEIKKIMGTDNLDEICEQIKQARV